MDELVQWLGEQLDEAAAAVRQADSDLAATLRKAGRDVADEYGDAEPPEEGVSTADRAWWIVQDAANYIARHNPARVLREIDAKRRIMECHEPWTASNGDTICGRCGREHIDGRPGGHFPCQTLRLLALPYSDRPGYREEWRP
jgi:hypothetical protein